VYIGPKSRTKRLRKTKIGIEVSHDTRDSDTTFKVKRSTCRGRGILWWPPAQLVYSVSYTLVKIRVKSVHMLHGCGAVHVIGNCWSCYFSTVTAVTSIVSLSAQ